MAALAKSLTPKEVLELSAAATMARSTSSLDLLAEHEKHAALEERTHQLRISSEYFEAKQKEIERLRQQGTVCCRKPQHHCMLIQLVFSGTSAIDFSEDNKAVLASLPDDAKFVPIGYVDEGQLLTDEPQWELLTDVPSHEQQEYVETMRSEQAALFLTDRKSTTMVS